MFVESVSFLGGSFTRNSLGELLIKLRKLSLQKNNILASAMSCIAISNGTVCTELYLQEEAL